jgi:hypothetical protein
MFDGRSRSAIVVATDQGVRAFGVVDSKPKALPEQLEDPLDGHGVLDRRVAEQDHVVHV